MKSPIALTRVRAARRAHRTRTRIRGTAARPRLSIFRSLRHLAVQVINDETGKTLVSSTDRMVKGEGKKPLEVAALIGADVAAKAKEAGITAVVFDRGAYKYHGRVKAVADAAREGGLEF